MLRDRAREIGGWIVYVNAVGGQDELVFDGGSLVMGPDGEVACRAALLRGGPADRRRRRRAARAEPTPSWPEPPESIYRALVLGLRRLRPEERVPRRRRSGCRAGSTPRSSPRSPPTRSVRRPSARSRCRRRTRVPRASRTPSTSPRGSGSGSTRRRSMRCSTPTGRRSSRCSRAGPRTSPRRTSRRGSAGTC